MTDEEKARIDRMSLYDMLYRWRFSPIGSFQDSDPKSDYFIKVMQERREADPAAWTAVSKAVGW